MEKYMVKEDIKVLGKPVPTFPLGISEVFDSLMHLLPDGASRNYYGISWMENNKMIYFAAAQEKFDGEAESYRCEPSIIEKGEYLIAPIHDWRLKLECIKDVFHELLQDQRVDFAKPCIEWYRTHDEMWCMVKIKTKVEDNVKVQA
jgi:hypothetical protein